MDNDLLLVISKKEEKVCGIIYADQLSYMISPDGDYPHSRDRFSDDVIFVPYRRSTSEKLKEMYNAIRVDDDGIFSELTSVARELDGKIVRTVAPDMTTLEMTMSCGLNCVVQFSVKRNKLMLFLSCSSILEQTGFGTCTSETLHEIKQELITLHAAQVRKQG